jgi:acetylornithine deacetylase
MDNFVCLNGFERYFMDLDLFLEILSIDSSSSMEGRLSDFLIRRLPVSGCEVNVYMSDRQPSASNIMLSWGRPDIVFCTHYDTVPPYIPPTVEKREDGKTVIRGRGACDAKGQLISMYEACLELADRGEEGFGLLLLYGEEAGSLGAKEFRTKYEGGRYVIVGEPTDNGLSQQGHEVLCSDNKGQELPFRLSCLWSERCGTFHRYDECPEVCRFPD